MFRIGRVVSYQETALRGGVSDGRKDLDRDAGHGRDFREVAHLAGHGLSGSHEPVQRRVVYQVDGLGRIFIAEQHALLPFHAAGQPGGHDIGCCSCRGFEQAARIAFRLEHSGNDAW